MKPISKPPPSGKNAPERTVQGLSGIARRFSTLGEINARNREAERGKSGKFGGKKKGKKK